MALSCGMQCMKYLLFAFNLVFWIAGITVMSVGIWTRVSASEYASLMGESGFQAAANIMIAAGALVMFIGFVGCCGAIKENKCFLLLYFFLLLMIFILEIAAGILAYVKRDKVISTVEKAMNTSVAVEYGKSDKITKAVDHAQEMLKCCGAKGPKDWDTSDWKKKSNNGTVPQSCCKTPKSGCNKGAIGSGDYNTEGCAQALKDFIKGHMKTLGGIGVGIAIIQILGMIFSLCLFRSIGYEKI
ncbi:CD151 antigen isoform X1 [Exaiptasia diaphana]|uniref:Tetraspanin n=1 Tax=Exaiptasia diaphana TaxID=2652724 RepID=A0A913Y1N2_EXADI|nr:CD151 antigen isoform X1 [Exaiptasia diaphana]